LLWAFWDEQRRKRPTITKTTGKTPRQIGV
jgi:hypothetical protein